jgi:sigma-B regulation protein RsbU (phosphoserine phosphatase)
MQSPSSPNAPQAASGLRSRLPTGLAGAVLWLGIWFCALFVRRWIPGGFGTFLFILQFFVGIALVFVAVPLIWGLVRKHMLWSLRNKLALTYLLIALTPVVLLVTLAGIFAYVAAGQFAIHLADSRLLAELSQMSGESGHRTDLISPLLERRMSGTPDTKDATSVVLNETDRSAALDLPRMKFHRETQAFLNGAPISLGSAPASSGPRG